MSDPGSVGALAFGPGPWPWPWPGNVIMTVPVPPKT